MDFDSVKTQSSSTKAAFKHLLQSDQAYGSGTYWGGAAGCHLPFHPGSNDGREAHM
jgi:hypothetical protein